MGGERGIINEGDVVGGEAFMNLQCHAISCFRPINGNNAGNLVRD